MKPIIYLIVAVVILGGVAFGVTKIPEGPGKYDQFASCITDSGAKFWGAFWCPHCQDQKKEFGKSAKLLPYNECSTANSQGQLAECTDAGIQSYPTWDFVKGTTTERVAGVLSFEKLSEYTGCPVPELASN